MNEIGDAAAQDWDAVVVGAGHNGLTAAAYLARAGKRVLVVERRDQLGGACTLERPFADERFAMSPCAYLVGLLHPLVIEELELAKRGYRTFVVDPMQWTPFDDGTSLYQWHDDERTVASMRALSSGNVDGYLEYHALFRRIREMLRNGPRGDTWIGDAPDRAALEELLADDKEALDVVLGEPIADVVERYVRDERIQSALHVEGLIGTFAGPRDEGTGWIHAHHSLGLIGGWSYVEGGMGRVSEYLADAATEAGAEIVTGAPVAAIVAGEGVRLDAGELIRAPTVISNADPVHTLGLVEGDVDTRFEKKIKSWRITSPVLKVNCALSRLPTFTAANGDPDVFRSQVVIGCSIDDAQRAADAAAAGEPALSWCEVYFQTAYDPSVAPPGAHTMSVFAQYVPYSLDWDERREEVADAAIALLARHAPDICECIVDRQVLAPPDVEARIGLTGGHIFQGECTPDQMWDRRFSPRTPVPGLYLCGAATHPGGSVMAVNGRNAAMAVLDG